MKQVISDKQPDDVVTYMDAVRYWQAFDNKNHIAYRTKGGIWSVLSSIRSETPTRYGFMYVKDLFKYPIEHNTVKFPSHNIYDCVSRAWERNKDEMYFFDDVAEMFRVIGDDMKTVVIDVTE